MMIVAMLDAALQSIRPTLEQNRMLYAPHRDEILRVCGEMDALIERMGRFNVSRGDYVCVPRFMVKKDDSL